MAYVQTKAGWGVSLLGLPGKWWLWLFCFAFVPLPVACFEVKQLLVQDQHAQQRQAAAEAAHLEQTRRLVLVVGEELQRIGAVIEEGSPLQARLLELQSDVQVCFQEMSYGATRAADVQVAQLLRQLCQLQPLESRELRVLREYLELVCGAELTADGSVDLEGQRRLRAEVLSLLESWGKMSSPAASGELKLKAGSLVLRTAGLRLRLQSPEEPAAFVLVQAEALAVAEQVIVEHAALLQQRRQELELRREQVRQAAEQLACVRVASQQQRERLQGLQSELCEVRDQRELLSQQLNERQQLERTVADVRGETDREVELLRLATELLKREILVEGGNWILGGRSVAAD